MARLGTLLSFLLSAGWSILVGASACVDTDKRGTAIGTTRTDSMGITIIQNPEEVQPLGAEYERIYMIYGISQIDPFRSLDDAVIANDRLYILDSDGRRVHAFDATGDHLWTAGREGNGPGEFRSPVRIDSYNDTIRILDRRKGFIYFDEFGEFVREMRVDRWSELLPAVYPMPWSGQTLLWSASQGEDGAYVRMVSVVRNGDTTLVGEERRRLGGTVEGSACGSTMAFYAWRSFDPPLIVDWTNRMIAMRGDWAEYRVDMSDASGNMRSVRRRIAPVRADMQRAMATYRLGVILPEECGKTVLREVVEVGGIREWIPLVTGILVTEDRGLWVEWKGEDGIATLDVFDSTGTYMGSLRDEGGMPAAVGWGGEWFVRFKRSVDDEPIVAVYRRSILE